MLEIFPPKMATSFVPVTGHFLVSITLLKDGSKNGMVI